MARRPKKVKIGEAEYKLVSRSKAWASKHEVFGQIQYHRKLIELAPNQNAKEILDTIIHEILHGIIAEFDVDVDGRQEEKIVTGIANGLTDVFRENPQLVEWLNAKSNKE